MKKVIGVLTIVFGGATPQYQSDCYAQGHQSSQVAIFFPTGKSYISTDFIQNKVSIKTLNAISQKGNLPHINSVKIQPYVSSEDLAKLKNKFSQETNKIIKQYIDTKLSIYKAYYFSKNIEITTYNI